MKIELHNLDGNGPRPCRVYEMPAGPIIRFWPEQYDHDERDYWPAVTDVPCPVEGCGHTVLWYEAGYSPGYRVCMRPTGEATFDHGSLRHRFIASGTAELPTLILIPD